MLLSEKKTSVSGTLEKHTMDIMKKLESQIPLHIKSFSDFSREYIKSLEKIYEINCKIESKVFGDMGLDEKSITLLDRYLEASSIFYASQIDMSAELFKSYLNMRLSLMESYNEFLKECSTVFRTDTTAC